MEAWKESSLRNSQAFQWPLSAYGKKVDARRAQGPSRSFASLHGFADMPYESPKRGWHGSSCLLVADKPTSDHMRQMSVPAAPGSLDDGVCQALLPPQPVFQRVPLSLFQLPEDRLFLHHIGSCCFPDSSYHCPTQHIRTSILSKRATSLGVILVVGVHSRQCSWGPAASGNLMCWRSM